MVCNSLLVQALASIQVYDNTSYNSFIKFTNFLISFEVVGAGVYPRVGLFGHQLTAGHTHSQRYSQSHSMDSGKKLEHGEETHANMRIHKLHTETSHNQSRD